MILTVGEVQWKLHFHTEFAQAGELWDVVVKCVIHSGPCILSHTEPRYCVNGPLGSARCSKKDNFNRRVGNRLALTRAISGLPVETRKLIWKAYWLKTRRPKESSAKFRERLSKVAA
jgi:hypothetical protein